MPELEKTALALHVGKLALLPLDPEAGVLRVVKRVAAGDESPAPPLQAELPAPERPNVDALVGRIGDGDALARYVSELANSIPAELNLDERRHKELDAVVAQLVSDLKTRRPEQRLAALHDARTQFAAILGEQLYAQLRASVDRKLTQQMMAQ